MAEPIGVGDVIERVDGDRVWGIAPGYIATCTGFVEDFGRCGCCDYRGPGITISPDPARMQGAWCPAHWRPISRRSDFAKTLAELKRSLDVTPPSVPAPREPARVS